jgi:hypothetical protein
MTLNKTGIVSQEPNSREILTLVHLVNCVRATGVYRCQPLAIRQPILVAHIGLSTGGLIHLQGASNNVLCGKLYWTDEPSGSTQIGVLENIWFEI